MALSDLTTQPHPTGDRCLQCDSRHACSCQSSDYDDEPTIHQCSCCREFTAADWAKLPLVGRQTVPEGVNGEPEYILEMRNCPCGSTRSIEIAPRVSQPNDAAEVRRAVKTVELHHMLIDLAAIRVAS